MIRRLTLALSFLIGFLSLASAQNVNLNCLTGTAAPNFWLPASSTNPCPVTAILQTSSGWTTKLLNGLTNSAVAIKASAGQIGKLYCYNPNGSVAYVQIFNIAAASVTVGASTPSQSYGIPASNASGFILPIIGDQYGTAISAAATTTATGGSAPSTALDCNVSYN